jgi:hypothetical protein
VKLADKTPLLLIEHDVEAMMKAEVDEDAVAVRKQP